MRYNTGWIGVDLDGTLAKYDNWNGPDSIGEPLQPMVDRIKTILQTGTTVKIFTARVASCQPPGDADKARTAIKAWTEKHIGQALEATAEKDWNMIEYYDDRAIQVDYNTGKLTIN